MCFPPAAGLSPAVLPSADSRVCCSRAVICSANPEGCECRSLVPSSHLRCLHSDVLAVQLCLHK